MDADPRPRYGPETPPSSHNGREGGPAPLRVAMVLPGLGRVRRGAEAAFLEVARGLAAFPDVRVELFGSGREGAEGLSVRGVPCVPRERFEAWPRLPCLRDEYSYEELTFALNLARAGRFRRRDFDAAICCSYPYVNWFLQWAGRGRGPRLVFVTQNGDWPCRADSREYRLFRCDGLVCTNPAYYERHRARYRAALIPNGVDPEAFRPRAEADDAGGIEVPEGSKVVLMVSALISSKRVADGVLAAARVPSAFLVVAGDGPERAEVSALCQRLLPGRHRMLGSLPREEMPALFRRADAFLHMSQDEPFGIVYLEAAASGLPVVAHDSEVPRWILGESALFADSGDAEAVAGALRRALSDEGRSLGRAARRRVEDGWTWAAQAAKYRDFLREVVAAPRGRARAEAAAS